MSDDDFATVSVTVSRKVDVPIDLLGDDDPRPAELRDRAEDWFWNHWRECLANEPGPDKDAVAVESVTLPQSAYQTADGERACTECGASVEDEPYELWLFHTCRACVTDAAEREAAE